MNLGRVGERGAKPCNVTKSGGFLWQRGRQVTPLVGFPLEQASQVTDPAV